MRGQKRRCFYISTSPDFEQWSEPRLVFSPDLRGDAGSLARIEAVRSLLDVRDDPNLMRTEFYGTGLYPHESCLVTFPWIFTVNNNARYGNQDGPMEVQLALSYYGGSNMTHGNPVFCRRNHPDRGKKFRDAIGLVRWNVDRFVSMESLEGRAACLRFRLHDASLYLFAMRRTA